MFSFDVLLLSLDSLLLPSPCKIYSPVLYAEITRDLQYSMRKNIFTHEISRNVYPYPKEEEEKEEEDETRNLMCVVVQNQSMEHRILP
jgi:hypothetical protein